MSCVLGTEVPALNGTCETFTFRGASYVYFFHVSEDINTDALANGKFFTFGAEFPQATASFYASFSKMTSFLV